MPFRMFRVLFAGVPFAMTISWHQHESILWAMFHGAFNWFYVVYYALVR